MGIMTRFTRIFKADIHGVMDQIENKELILKQCLREMEASLSKNKAQLNQLKTALDQNRNEIRQLDREKIKSEQDLNTAIEKQKEDIARLLIKKRLKTDKHSEAASRHAESIERKIEMMTERIAAQKHQYTELELRSESWIQKAEYRQWQENASNIMPDNSWHSISDEEVELELIKRKDVIKGVA